MSFDDAISALSKDALKHVKNNYVIGLGSGRAATAFVKSLSKYVQSKKLNVKCVPVPSHRAVMAVIIPSVADIDLFHRRKIRHRVGAVRAVVRVPQADRDAPGGEFLPAFGAPGNATRRVAPLARYTNIALRGAPNGSRAQAHETGQYQRPLVSVSKLLPTPPFPIMVPRRADGA